MKQIEFNSSALRGLEMSTEYFLVPNRTTSRPAPDDQDVEIVRTSPSYCADCTGDRYNFFRGEVWVFPVIVFAGLVMVTIAGFEIFVICKAYKLSSSHRNIFLGQVLLLGLFFCACVSIALTMTPTPVSCALVRFGLGVSYALVFASLLVKCVFLISLNTGVYLPAAYQALLLGFSVLIQIAISIQWLITSPPSVENVVYERFLTEKKHNLLFTAKDIERPIYSRRCRTSYIDTLLSLIYVVFLILFVSVLSVKARHVRNNYRESTYIGLSVGCSVPTWLVWMLSGFLVNDRHKDGCLALGLLVSATIIFAVMFVSKSRRLIALGSNGVYKEDREDQFSSISRTGSRYSPSFFHYQPGEYGFRQCMYQKPSNSTPSQACINGTLKTTEDQICECNEGNWRCTPKCYKQKVVFVGCDLCSCKGDQPDEVPRLCTELKCLHLNPEDGTYTTLEPTLSSNPNVYFYCSNGVHPGMIY